ncbi:NAD+ synthase [Glycomyces buryatensis]|uniref:Glutamine-dependent NAD(+) synthetase n=1 Tax=Glycomyces buryatensis TaxID=2570927 RepID=A0A4S8QDG2_9ACTN|nr:NAD+ synthase [Glycomyces buryatensis]THV42583.1 NAD+ synthase [Glycomyces buryatensis]
MPTLRIALAQDNPVVGDLDANAALIRAAAGAASAAGAHLLATGEQSLTGYPVEDLALRHSFVEASRERLIRLAAELAEDGHGALPVAVGYLDSDGPIPERIGAVGGRGIRNALALLQDGKVLFRYYKHHFPNYGVFDEERYFVSGHELHLARIGGVDVAFTICEDIWGGVPITAADEAEAGLVVNINASPYEQGKHERRLALVKERSAEVGAPIAYLNLVGGQDEIVFDGGSFIADTAGKILSSARRFSSELLITDVELAAASGADVANHSGTTMSTSLHVISAEPAAMETRIEPSYAPDLERLEEIWEALCLGLGDYVRKNGFESVIFGLSGGIDSALTAVIARDAIGADRVHTVAMPSRYSSQHSQDDAADLAARCGINHSVEEIQPIVDSYLADIGISGLALENLQARVRGNILMALSNQHGHLVLAPGNKSEYAVGYSTIYGDAVGGFAPIKDVLKTLVYELATWRNAKARSLGETEPIPENTILKPPSAELRPDQKDSDSLPDYEILDGILSGYVDSDRGREDLVEQGYPADVVDRIAGLVDRAEYKRRQSAPGTKITVKSFGRDRRLPITNRFRGK